MSRESPLIAVVDDESAVRTALRRLLDSAGIAVETFDSGEQFLASLDKNSPDCVVLDLHMPEMTGFDVLARLAERQSGVPVVVITGHDSPNAEASVLGGGASAYLRKPIKDRVLLDAISAAMARPVGNPPLQS